MKQRILIGVLLALWSALAPAAVIKTIQAGATDQTVVIKIIDSADGTPETGVVFNTSGIDLEYWRHGANSVTDITEATQTVSGAHLDGGFVHLGNGLYRLDLPDAAVASGATAVEVMGTVTGMIVIGGTVDLSPPVNVVAYGGTAGTFTSGRPNVNASHLGGTSQTGRDIGASVLLSSGTGTGQISLSSGAVLLQPTQTGVTIPTVTTVGTVNALAANSLTAAAAAADLTTELQSGLATASALATVDTVVDAILDDTGTTGVLIAESTSNCREVLGCDTQGTLSGTHSTTTADLGTNAPSNDITGMTLVIPTHNFSRAISSYNTSTGVATWDTATAVTLANANQWYLYATAPSSGGGGLDAAGVRSAIGLASANLDTQLGTIDTNVDAILVDTSTTLDDLVDDLESRLGTPSNLGGGATVAANLADIEGQTDDIGAAGAGLTAADDAVMTRLGAPAGASISADIAAVKSDSAAILVDTGTTLDGKLDTIDTVADAIKVKTDQLTFGVTNQLNVNVESMNTVEVLGTGTAADPWNGE